MITQSIRQVGNSAPLRLKWTLALLSMLVALFGLAGTAVAGTGFVATSYPATVKGLSPSATEELSIPSYGLYKCAESQLNGALGAPSKTLSAAPTWGSCTGPLKSITTFAANGCEFQFIPSPGSYGSFEGEAAIGPAGCGPITIKGPAGFCKISIPSQGGLEATYSNSGSGSGARVLAHVEASNLEYTMEAPCAKKTLTDGSYSSANWELAGYNGGGSSNPIQIYEPFQVAPTTKTGAPSGVSATEGTVRGSINPNALETTYQFEYGPTTSYGSKAPASPKSLGPESVGVPVSQALSGLSSSSVYHYRLAATNSQGTTYGRDRTFATIPSSAKAAEINWPSGTTVLTGAGTAAKQTLTTNSGSVECEEVTGSVFDIADTSASGIVLEAIAYHNKGKATCSGPFGTEPEIGMNLCPYEFHVGEAIATNEAKGSVTIGSCAVENAIVMSAPLCTIRVPHLQTVGPVYYRTSGEKVEVELAMGGITTESSGLFCNKGTYTKATYTGKILLAGNKGSISIK